MTNTALAVIEIKNPIQAFTEKGLDPIIEKIGQEARAEASGLDISTAKGRDEIRSLAYKIAQSKTALDKVGKELIAGQKETIKKVDAERARGWERLEALQKEVRAPLTEWEKKEEDRVAAHEAALAAIPEHPAYGQKETAAELAERLAKLEGYPARDWQEFSARAEKTLADEIARTKTLLAAAQEREAKEAELERLRREEAERKQREHEERLKAEAAEKARLEAEEKARREAEAEAARVKAEQEKAEQERLRIEQEKEAEARRAQEAEERARKAEEARIAAEAKAKADLLAAEEKAKADALAAEERAQLATFQAAKRERERIEAEQRAEAEAAAKREADKKHKAQVNNEILSAIVSHCNSETVDVTPEIGKAIIAAIAKGLIPHLKISY